MGQKLQEWLDKAGINAQEVNGAKAIPNIAYDNYRELFDLDDYKVDGASGGAIWLRPVNPTQKKGEFVYLLPDGRYGWIASDEVTYSYRDKQSNSEFNKGYLVELLQPLEAKGGEVISLILVHYSGIRTVGKSEEAEVLEANKGKRLDVVG